MANSEELVKIHLIGLFAKGENRAHPISVRVLTYVIAKQPNISEIS